MKSRHMQSLAQSSIRGSFTSEGKHRWSTGPRSRKLNVPVAAATRSEHGGE